MTSLEFGSKKVAELADALDTQLSNEAIETAEHLARRTDFEHPLNFGPTTVATSSIYLACLLVNEKVTQAEIAENCDISAVAIRNCYPQIGITLKGHEDRETPEQRWQRVRNNAGDVYVFGGSTLEGE